MSGPGWCRVALRLVPLASWRPFCLGVFASGRRLGVAPFFAHGVKIASDQDVAVLLFLGKVLDSAVIVVFDHVWPVIDGDRNRRSLSDICEPRHDILRIVA